MCVCVQVNAHKLVCMQVNTRKNVCMQVNTHMIVCTVNPAEYFVRTQFSYPGLSDLSYA